jgi:chorismate synthase
MKLRFLTAGESHGPALIGMIEGLPSGLNIDTQFIHNELKRRKLGYGRGSRQKMEDDQIKILSGVRFSQSLGSPITFLIENKDWKNWVDIMTVEGPKPDEVKRKLEVPRPGHADYVGGIKYQHEDMRNVLERASARETTIRVALGGLAKCFLKELGIGIHSRVTEVGSVKDTTRPTDSQLLELNKLVDQSQLRILDSTTDAEAKKLVQEAQKRGETLGGIFEVYALGMPLGFGSYVQWDRRLEAAIGAHFLSLNAIKGVEVGMGFELGRSWGSESHDEYKPRSEKNRVDYISNRSGGIDGGMTTGQPIIVRAAMKPLATLMSPLSSVHLAKGVAEEAHVERSDVCAVSAAAVIGETLLALVLAETVLDKLGGDSMSEVLERWSRWKNFQK